MYFLQVLQQVAGVELGLHVIAEDDRPADPLAVDFAPAELGPAGVGDAHVQLVLLHLLPVLGGDNVPQGVGEVVLHHLGHARGARGEVHQHNVVPAGGLLAGGAGEGVGELLQLLVEVQPALPLLRHQNLVLQGGDVRLGGLHLLNDEGVVDAHHRADLGGVAPVDDVLFRQLQGAGDEDGPQFVQGRGAHPVLPPAAEDEHHHAALLHAQALKEVGGLVGQALDVGKGEDFLVVLLIAPHQGFFLGLFFGPGVHHVKAEVEVLRHVHGIIGFKILVGVKLDTGQEFFQQIVHG